MECLKRDTFKWTSDAQDSFELIKTKVTEAHCLALSNFSKVFEVECDASRMGFGTIFSQKAKPIAFFNEKLSEAKKKYSTYNK